MQTTPPGDPVRAPGEPFEGAPREDAAALESEAPLLADLERQREALRLDIRRIEATLAEGLEVESGLYERLLRSRRISGKLENRISVVRLQQRIRAGH